jgi:glycosyltransferase involved in cell wall biosynthesis
MIVNNPCVNDTRVIKEAEALAAAGSNVRVLCRTGKGVPESESRKGVEYLRVDLTPSIGDIVKQTRLPPLMLALFGAGEAVLALIAMPVIMVRAAGRMLKPWITDATRRVGRKVVGRWGGVARAMLKYSLHGLSRYAIRTAAVRSHCEQFRPEVIHAHDLSALPVALLAGAHVAARVIYDAHELETHRNGLTPLDQRLTSLIERRHIAQAAKVITVCESIATHLEREYGIPRPAVIMNAPDPAAPGHVERTLRDVVGLASSVPLAVYVGKVTFGRGLEQLVQAMPHMAAFHVAMLGPRVERIADGLIDLARELGVADRLHLVNSVPPAEVVPFIATADLGVVPIQDVCLSYRYCMPNKLFEMAFAGIPVCVSNLPEMREFVEREHVGVVMDERDPQDIARVMQALYERRDEYVARGENLERMKARYAWSNQAEQLRRCYQELIGFPASQA